MLAATAMGDTPCGIFAQKQKHGPAPHSFFTILYSMKGLAAPIPPHAPSPGLVRLPAAPRPPRARPLL
ncbi:protein of unknown function [Shinella sp. WSC3-e]|nr:hypothetical protein SHINE37_40294 [Rhizobiaceae bacterium]CAK7254978.1 protein of unknown function [Shinella sp. WSC3-e]